MTSETIMAHGFAPKIESEKKNITAKQTLQEWVSFFETLKDPRGKQGSWTLGKEAQKTAKTLI